MTQLKTNADAFFVKDPQSNVLALLADLEASLCSSHRALLSRNVARLNELTHEQDALQRAISNQWLADVDQEELASNGPLLNERRLAQMCVLHLGRVQQILLKRMQRRLRVLGNLMAGPYETYSLTPTPISIRRTPQSSTEV